MVLQHKIHWSYDAGLSVNHLQVILSRWYSLTYCTCIGIERCMGVYEHAHTHTYTYVHTYVLINANKPTYSLTKGYLDLLKVCMCVCACACACVRACVHACVRARVHGRMRAYVYASAMNLKISPTDRQTETDSKTDSLG